MPKILATGAAFNLDEMFMNFQSNKLKISCKECQEINGNPHRDVLAKQIFRECVKLVLNDVIENNVTFQLPTGKKKCDIHMKRVQGEDFRNLKRSGKWRDVNLMSSNFTGHELGLYMYGPMEPRVKTIYVNKEMKEKITKYTNEGKLYC